MIFIHYPEGDARRDDAILPHGTPVAVVKKLPNVVIVEDLRPETWGATHVVHPDYLRRQAIKEGKS